MYTVLQFERAHKPSSYITLTHPSITNQAGVDIACPELSVNFRDRHHHTTSRSPSLSRTHRPNTANEYPTAVDLNHISMASGLPTKINSLLGLPNELQLIIIKFFDFPAHFQLSTVNRHFREITPAATCSDLLTAEQTKWARDQKLFACIDCLSLRNQSKFSYAMTHINKCLSGAESSRRFCIDCGTTSKTGFPTRYRLGCDLYTLLEKPGDLRSWGVFCKVCKIYSTTAARPSKGFEDVHNLRHERGPYLALNVNKEAGGVCFQCWWTEHLKVQPGSTYG